MNIVQYTALSILLILITRIAHTDETIYYQLEVGVPEVEYNNLHLVERTEDGPLYYSKFRWINTPVPVLFAGAKYLSEIKYYFLRFDIPANIDGIKEGKIGTVSLTKEQDRKVQKYLGSIVQYGKYLTTERSLYSKHVDFDSSSELNALYKRNKKLYLKLTNIIKNIGAVPSPNISKWLKVQHGATNSSIGLFSWKVTYPPKSVLTFELDGVRFSGTVGIVGFPADFIYWQHNR